MTSTAALPRSDEEEEMLLLNGLGQRPGHLLRALRALAVPSLTSTVILSVTQ